jgi:P-type conjugative transfer protein TrbJ
LQYDSQSLQNQRKNLKNLDSGLTMRNLDILIDSLDKIEQLNKHSDSFIFQNKELVNKFWDYYKKDPNEFQQITGMDKKGLQGKTNDINKADTASRYAVYDAMTQSNMSAKIKDDSANLKELIKASQNSEGTLQAIQATNNLIGKNIEILLQLRTILEKNLKMIGAIAMAQDTDNQSKAAIHNQYETIRSRDNITSKRNLDAQKQTWKKPIKWGY